MMEEMIDYMYCLFIASGIGRDYIIMGGCIRICMLVIAKWRFYCIGRCTKSCDELGMSVVMQLRY